MVPHGVVPPRRTPAKARTVPILLLLGIALWPACAPMPTKPRATVLVSGRVSDRSGRPILGASVDYYPAMNSLAAFYRPQRAQTDSTGSYTLELVAGLYRQIIGLPSNVGSGGYHDAQVTVSPQNSRFDFVIDGFRVGGRVIAPTGATLSDAFVYAISLSGPYVDAVSSTQSGAFSLFLRAGSYYVTVSPSYFSGFPHVQLDGVPVQADTTFDILLGGNLVTGTVLGPGAGPLESVLVSASGSDAVHTRTALDGTYSLYAHSGDYRFFCQPGGSNSYILARISPIRTITGPGTFDFDLSGVEWTGTVRSATTLSPIEGVGVSAALFGDAYDRHASATTDAAGQFRLVLEPNREYSLSFHSSTTLALTYPGIFAADTTFDIVLEPAPTP